MRALKWVGGTVLILFVLIALFFTFGLNLLKGPITRAVSDATGRELVIEGRLGPVWSWVHPRIRAEGVTFANADWGKADYLLSADAIEASISVFPLLTGRVVLPEVHLQGAELSLEQDADGRKNWILKQDPDEQKDESRLFIKLLTVDEGRLHWEDAWREHSFLADLSADETGIQFTGEGTYSGMPLEAKGHLGHVLALRDESTPFPINGEIKIGDTAATLEGTLTGLVGFKGIDLQFKQLSGKTMEDLYWIIGLAFPDTSPYKLSGRLLRTDGMWRFENFAGKVGESDLAGTLQVDTGGKRPYMHGDLTSKVLNFADLGPLVGTNQPREGGGVLPDAPFNVDRWESLDADVRLKAGTIKRPEALPIDNLATRWQLRDKVLSFNPLEFGIAGGKLAGTIKVDGNKEPVRGDVAMRVRQLQLAKLFPTVKQAQGSIGDLNGLIELSGTGDSVGKLLGSSAGKIGIYMDEGKVSRFLMADGAAALGRGTREAEGRRGDRHPLRDRRLRRQGRRRTGERFRLRHRRGQCRRQRHHQPQDRGDGPHAQAPAEGPQHRLLAHAPAHQGHLQRAGYRPRHGQAGRPRRRHHRDGHPQPASRHPAAARGRQGERQQLRCAHCPGERFFEEKATGRG
jgi:uncharacterized protein involved in outer membrane biogenesis